MKQDKALTSDMAFIHPDTPMFSELITRLQADDALSTTRRRDMVSGLTRVAKALGRPSEAVPADVGWLQPRLARLNAAKLGLAEKSWQNAVSDARAAMVHFGIVKRRWSRPSDLSPAWQSLWKSARASGNTSMQAAICRFIYFLSWQGVGPDDVRLDHVLAFHEAVKANEIRKSPETAMRAAIDGWNL
ncbi:MAG: hypothetical protein Q7J57_16870, partial [Gemmobacter sp.]|nr:hypothetical protein [Gemmobacter sp.]